MMSLVLTVTNYTLICVYYSYSQNWILTFPWPVTRSRSLKTIYCHVYSYITQNSIILELPERFVSNKIVSDTRLLLHNYNVTLLSLLHGLTVSAAIICFHSYTYNAYISYHSNAINQSKVNGVN